ncbi:hypothetical protein [Sphaerotilus sp.]|uniref:hypothetical protein n=1 Tax=Sphaerotilus sp. TaxID=2093942 RepID=UPI002ACD8E9C|nr:hypothetical protein [Sphaerotilus sp.]MDZ7857385.1 hypothetical protein [Sphaerotilus sp.]
MSSSLPSFVRPVLVLAFPLLLSACGGGGSSSGELVPALVIDTPSAPTSASASESFPTGLAVASPTELTSTAAAAATTVRALAALPGAGAGRAELTDMASRIEAVLAGDASVSLGGLLRFGNLFRPAGNAGCYGPQLLYANHEDGSGTESGLLPGGDLGLWHATDAASGQPCVVAQLNERTAGMTHTTRQSLLLMAAMRATIAGSGGLLAMPAAGFRTDLTAPFGTVLAALPALTGLHVDAATVALDPFGKTYTYRLALHQGTGASARSGEIVLQHRPGATAAAYSGVLRVAGFDLTTDASAGCSDRMTSGRYQRARLTTVRYSRRADQIDFGARSGQYCGAPADPADADHAAQVASFTASGELDPAVQLPAGAPGLAVAAGSATGWRGNFDRFGGRYDRTTGAGQFLYAWQAGTGDRHARALAVRSTYDSAADTRTVQGHFAFTDALATTDGSLLGMVCNWAGPGAQHIPAPLFQSQTATLAGLASTFVATASRLTYAPTNACVSTTTLFDADGDGTLTAGEGAGTPQALDAPASSSVTVQEELLTRGYVQPEYF